MSEHNIPHSEYVLQVVQVLGHGREVHGIADDLVVVRGLGLGHFLQERIRVFLTIGPISYCTPTVFARQYLVVLELVQHALHARVEIFELFRRGEFLSRVSTSACLSTDAQPVTYPLLGGALLHIGHQTAQLSVRIHVLLLLRHFVASNLDLKGRHGLCILIVLVLLLQQLGVVSHAS